MSSLTDSQGIKYLKILSLSRYVSMAVLGRFWSLNLGLWDVVTPWVYKVVWVLSAWRGGKWKKVHLKVAQSWALGWEFGRGSVDSSSHTEHRNYHKEWAQQIRLRIGSRSSLDLSLRSRENRGRRVLIPTSLEKAAISLGIKLIF